jgi:hypothetical protein
MTCFAARSAGSSGQREGAMIIIQTIGEQHWQHMVRKKGRENEWVVSLDLEHEHGFS